MPPDGVLLLSDEVSFDAIAVEQFVQRRYRETKEKLEQSKIKGLSSATNSLASVAVNLSEILSLFVPQSPEYTIPFGCLMIVFEVTPSSLFHG